jgi:hypothetical protein
MICAGSRSVPFWTAFPGGTEICQACSHISDWIKTCKKEHNGCQDGEQRASNLAVSERILEAEALGSLFNYGH